MRKHTLRCCVLLAVSLAALALLLLFTGRGAHPARLQSLMVDEAGYQTLMQARQPAPELLPTLRCNDRPLPQAGGSYYYSMVEGDAQALDPIVSASGEKSVRLAFRKRALDADFLRSGEGLPFLVYTDSGYAEGTLVFTTLPVMQIDAGGLEVLDRTEKKARMTLFDNREQVADHARIQRSDTTIRIRGASSAAQPKKSYRLSLYTMSLGNNRRSSDLSLLGMRADEDWILYAGGNDPERIRNHFCNQLWYETGAAYNDLGVTLGVECRYVELILNDSYMGLYTLMFPLDAKQVELPENGYYYRGVSYEDTTPEMLDRAGKETKVGGWELQYPKRAAGPQTWAPLSEYFSNVPHGSNAALCAFVDEKMDEKNIISLQLFLSLVQGLDNYYKNNNVLVYPTAEGGQRFLLAPWDLDLTFGNMGSRESEWDSAPYSKAPDEPYHPWALPGSRMPELSDAFRTGLCARYRELRDGPWSDGAILAELDRYEAQIYGSGAMARERLRWPTAPDSQDLDRFRAYCLARLRYLDACYGEVAQ